MKNLNAPSLVRELLECGFPLIENLTPGTAVYAELQKAARAEMAQVFTHKGEQTFVFGPLGQLTFKYHNMGAVDTCNLFDIDELIIFNFYWKNRKQYKTMADMGANIGLHSVIAAKCGFQVRSFEPDPVHFALLQEHLQKNAITTCTPYNAACSSEKGVMSFCRVKGNTTGSHLTGSKQNPYGELDYFDVPVENALEHMRWADIVKMDVEGHEATILCATDRALWESTDALMEIQNQENAALVFEHFQKIGVHLFAQRKGWQRVNSVQEMPCGYKDGTLFASCKDTMPW